MSKTLSHTSHHDLHGIIEMLRASGERLTGNRLAVLAYLCKQTTPVSVKDLEQAFPRINIVTLYRILEYYNDQGIVKKLTHNSKEQLFELGDPYHRHHHHCICQRCGKMQDITCQLKIPKLKDFVPQMHVVTVYGLCRACLNSR